MHVIPVHARRRGTGCGTWGSSTAGAARRWPAGDQRRCARTAATARPGPCRPTFNQRHRQEHEARSHLRCNALLFGCVQGQRQHRHQAQSGNQAVQGRGRDQAPAAAAITRGQLGRHAHLQLPRAWRAARPGRRRLPALQRPRSAMRRDARRGRPLHRHAPHAQPWHAEGDQHRQHRQQQRRRRQDQRRRCHRDQRQRGQCQQWPDGAPAGRPLRRYRPAAGPAVRRCGWHPAAPVPVAARGGRTTRADRGRCAGVASWPISFSK